MVLWAVSERDTAQSQSQTQSQCGEKKPLMSYDFPSLTKPKVKLGLVIEASL